MLALYERFQESVFANTIGLTLLHFLWQGLLLGLVLVLVLALLKGRSPQARYTVS
jgi:hypothetical protein